MGPLECKLTILTDKEGRKKVKYDVIPSGPFPVKVEADLCDDDRTKETVKRLNRFISGNPAFCERDDLQILGKHLYHILFDGISTIEDKRLGELFIQTYGHFETDFKEAKKQTGVDPDFRLRVTLIFKEGMDELAGYPWKFLYITRPNNTGFFLAGEKTELILTRFVPELGTPHSKPADKKLVILVAWSQPKELGPVDEYDTIVSIKTLAENISTNVENKRIEVIPFPQATHNGLKKMINDKKPNIVHFIGHGEIKEGKSKIALMKTQNQIDHDKAKMIGRRGEPEHADWVDSASIRALFSDNPPRLVFLHACNSAKVPNSLKVFKSSAEQVLRANVPFVVAMQYEISNEDATFFAQTFYAKLGEGMSIDEAVKSGRNELGRKAPSWGHPRFGTPVVYFQSDDSVIVEKGVKQEEGKAKIEVLGKQDCPYPNCRNIVSPDQKRCSCEMKLKLIQCPKCQKANPIDEEDCLFAGCDYVFKPAEPQVTAAASAKAPHAQVPGHERGLLV